MRRIGRAGWWPLALEITLLTLVAVLIVMHALAGIDRAAYAAVQPVATGSADFVFSAVTLLGRTDVAVGLAIVVTLVAIMRQRRLFPTIAPLAIFAVLPLVDALKNGVGQRRPPAGSGHDLQLLPTFLPRAAESLSFPSNHAALAAFLAVVVGHLAPRLRLLVWALAIMVALSRLYLDKHWLSDVTAGLLLGTIVGEAAWLVASALAARVRR